MKKTILFISAVLFIVSSCCQKPGQRWSEEKAAKWYEEHGWVSGCNFTPSNAINQLENPQKIVEARKTIARIMTVIRENELKADNSAQ